MKREEIKAIFPDATDEQLSSVLNINGGDVEKVKSKVTALEADIAKKQKDVDDLNAEFTKLKESNATAEDWKQKFNDLQADIADKQKKADEERKEKERLAGIAARFDAVVGEKKWSHEAVKAAYLAKFGDAIGKEEFAGKSDAEVFHALTKDDAAAFAGVKGVKLDGGNPHGGGGDDDTVARAVMGLPAK